MKTTRMLAGLMVIGLSVVGTLWAQQAPVAQVSQRTTAMAAPYKAADPATRAKKMTDRLTSQLGLDEASAKKVYDLALARAQTIDGIQTGSDDNHTKAQKLQANAEDFKAKMKAVLTSDQYTKFLAMKHHGGGDGKPGGDTQ